MKSHDIQMDGYSCCLGDIYTYSFGSKTGSFFLSGIVVSFASTVFILDDNHA